MSKPQQELFPKTPKKPQKTPNPAAVALGQLGATKGGRARAAIMTAEQRTEIAKKAAAKRWGDSTSGSTRNVPPPADKGKPNSAGDSGAKEPPYSLFPGILKIGDVDLEVHVLNDNRRVISQRAMLRALVPDSDFGKLQRYLLGIPGVTADKIPEPIIFKIPGNVTAHGFEASFLIDVCEWYMLASEKGLLKPNQTHLARQASAILRASAKVGVIALIDEATGYQVHRKKQELQLKLQAFIAEDMQEWARVFPPEFWIELARLEGVKYHATQRPLRWGKYVMAFVYDAIDQDVGGKLRAINPHPQHGRNHHQWLKEFGKDKLKEQLTRVITIMQLCKDMEEFRVKFASIFDKNPNQMAWEGFF